MVKQTVKSDLLPMFLKPYVNVVKGNEKLGLKALNGIDCISSISGNEPLFIKKTGKYLFDPNEPSAIGFCSRNCIFCYDKACLKMRKNVAESRLQNNRVLYYDDMAYYNAIDDYMFRKTFLNTANKNIFGKPTMRLNCGGDLKSKDDLYKIFAIGRNHPDAIIYLYTHHTFIFDKKIHDEMPDNVFINVSRENSVSEEVLSEFPRYNQFVVVDKNHTDKIPTDAVFCRGCSTNKSLKCSQCGRCFSRLRNGNGRITYERMR